MKRRLYLIILLAAVTLSGIAQNIGEAFYIYRNDGQFNAFFRDEVLSIEYSYEDAGGNHYDEIVTQIVNTTDSVYKIPLAAIDSVSFIQPETLYKNDVVKMEPLLPYIVSVDGLTLTFSSNMPAGLMPKEGDVLIQDNFNSELLPEGFAGRIIQCTGQQVICDSVSFEDIYEQIVCYGSFYAIDEGANNNMRFVPRRADFSTGIEINGLVGTKGSGIYCSARGKLEMTLRVLFKYSLIEPPYFELSLSPELNVAFEAGVKGHLQSENLLSNRYTLIALPIPDTPFMFRVWGGEVLNCTVDASVTASTEASLGFKIGVKYEDGAFKGICQNTSKWFSTPDVTGNISGSIFGGIQLGYGICTYGNVVSLNFENEAGPEFVANLSEDLMNSNKYEELQKAYFDLNLKASTGISINAKIHKWVNVSEKWNLLSARMNINSWKLVPTFQEPNVEVDGPTSATISIVPSEKLLFPALIGLGVWDEYGELCDALYCPNTYRVFENWGFSQYETTFKNLKESLNYTVYPLVSLFGVEIRATPSKDFQTKSFPVTLSDFKVRNSQYEKGAFIHDGVAYDYRFDVSVTASLDDDAEGIADWGYVYNDPNGKEAFISLKQFGRTYTDTRWAYFRNGTPPFNCTLYGFVKYVGSDEYVYGEPHDYPLDFDKPLCPDHNHPHWIDLGLPSGTLWKCCNEGANSPSKDGEYYKFGQVSSAPGVFQVMELLNYTTSVWTTLDGVKGCRFTGPNGGSIFLPASGLKWQGAKHYVGKQGNYWGGTSDGSQDSAFNIYFDTSEATWEGFYDGTGWEYTVRSVSPVNH